jgi:hypothetical protein
MTFEVIDLLSVFGQKCEQFSGRKAFKEIIIKEDRIFLYICIYLIIPSPLSFRKSLGRSWISKNVTPYIGVHFLICSFYYVFGI